MEMEERPQRFRRLIVPHHDRVHAFARSLCRSLAEGDDVFQEAMLRAFDKLDGLRDEAAFRVWSPSTGSSSPCIAPIVDARSGAG